MNRTKLIKNIILIVKAYLYNKITSQQTSIKLIDLIDKYTNGIKNNWNKTSEILPKTDLYKDNYPYLVAYTEYNKTLAYMYKGIWRDWEFQNEIKPPLFWMEIELIPKKEIKD